MEHYAITVDQVSKAYKIYQKPADRLWEAFYRKPRHTLFKSLENISFQVRSGESVGIIGDNGAGKSTLLKLLAGTLTPTTGSVSTNGRVAALLELGAGFHPEFTGRQNIHLNATLLGLTENEISQREDDIIAFSELGDRIDRPVKTYSSGMYMRLAFSVATSVDPDILIIDEALSVGDQHFQKKSIDRIIGFREVGKTILFCTHSMYLIHELCDRALWLESGQQSGLGPTEAVVRQYLEKVKRDNEKDVPTSDGSLEKSGQLIAIQQISLLDSNGQSIDVLKALEPLRLRVDLATLVSRTVTGHIGIGLFDDGGEMMFYVTTRDAGLPPMAFFDKQSIDLHIPLFRILRGEYQIRVVVGDDSALLPLCDAATSYFGVIGGRSDLGLVKMEYEWGDLRIR